jgi:hypothetical protein
MILTLILDGSLPEFMAGQRLAKMNMVLKMVAAVCGVEAYAVYPIESIQDTLAKLLIKG